MSGLSVTAENNQDRSFFLFKFLVDQKSTLDKYNIELLKIPDDILTRADIQDSKYKVKNPREVEKSGDMHLFKWKGSSRSSLILASEGLKLPDVKSIVISQGERLVFPPRRILMVTADLNITPEDFSTGLSDLVHITGDLWYER